MNFRDYKYLWESLNKKKSLKLMSELMSESLNEKV